MDTGGAAGPGGDDSEEPAYFDLPSTFRLLFREERCQANEPDLWVRCLKMGRSPLHRSAQQESAEADRRATAMLKKDAAENTAAAVHSTQQSAEGLAKSVAEVYNLQRRLGDAMAAKEAKACPPIPRGNTRPLLPRRSSVR